MCSWPFRVCCVRDAHLRPAPSARTVTLPRDIDADSPLPFGKTTPSASSIFLLLVGTTKGKASAGLPSAKHNPLWWELRPSCRGLSAYTNPTYRAFRGSPIIRYLPVRGNASLGHLPDNVVCPLKQSLPSICPIARCPCLTKLSIRACLQACFCSPYAREGYRHSEVAVRRRHIASDVQRQPHVSTADKVLS